MSSTQPAVAILAKAPGAGRSKTRLCPPCTAEQAALLAEAMLLDTFDAVLASRLGRRVLFLEGPPGPWVPDGVEVRVQRGDGQAARIASAFVELDEPAILIGMDTPQLTAQMLDDAGARLLEPGVDAVLAPASDGGWWLAGLKVPNAAAFLEVPMSRTDTIEHQRRRLSSLRLRWVEVGELADVDDWPSAGRVAAGAPDTRFARLFGRIAGAVDDGRATTSPDGRPPSGGPAEHAWSGNDGSEP